MDKIIAQKKLIAQYMGYKLDNDWVIIDDSYDGKYHVSVLDYHSSWNKIMPVVEKINKHIYHGDSADCGDDYAFMRTFGMIDVETGQYMVRINRCPLFKADTFIGAVLLAVVDFIESYNSSQVK